MHRLFIFLSRIDAYVLFRLTTPVVHFCSRRWGWDFVKLAAAVWAMGAVCYIGWGVSSVMSVPIILKPLFTIAALMFCYFHFVFLRIGVRGAKRATRDALNPNVLNLWSIRTSGLLILPAMSVPSPPGWMPDWIMGATFLTLASYYVLSVDKPPPKEEKQRLPAGLALAGAS